MAAYVIAMIEVTDPEPYQEYRNGVQAMLDQYGGRFIVRGGNHETMEGDWRPGRIVVIEFPTLARAQEWYHSPEYQTLITIRQRNSRARMLTIVDGVPEE